MAQLVLMNGKTLQGQLRGVNVPTGMSPVLPSKRMWQRSEFGGGFDLSSHPRLTERGVNLIHRKVESLEEVSGRGVRGWRREEGRCSLLLG